MEIKNMTKYNMAKIADALKTKTYVHADQKILEMFAYQNLYPFDIDDALNLERGTSHDAITAYLVALRWDAEIKANESEVNYADE